MYRVFDGSFGHVISRHRSLAAAKKAAGCPSKSFRRIAAPTEHIVMRQWIAVSLPGTCNWVAYEQPAET